MKVINWIAYLFYRLFLKCGKDDWDAKYTAKLFVGMFLVPLLGGIIELTLCFRHPEYLERYFTPVFGAFSALVILVFLLWYYWNRWGERMRGIDMIYNTWSPKKQKWMLAVPIVADIISFAIGFAAYNIVRYYY